MTKKKSLVLVDKGDMTTFLQELWRISNDFDELSYRFDEVSALMDSINFDFDSEKSGCFFYLSERLYNENKLKFIELQERLNKTLFNARGIAK